MGWSVFSLFFCSLQLNSSTRPCLVPAPLITPHLTHTFPLTSLSLTFSLSPALPLSFFSHLPLLFLTSACSHIPVGDLLFFFVFLSPVLLLLLTIHSGSTLQWLHWCSRTSTYSCLLSFHPIIFMAWESMCIRIIALTQTGEPGPSSPGMLFLTGWGIQGHTAIGLRNTHAHVHSVTASLSIPITSCFFFVFFPLVTDIQNILCARRLTFDMSS